MTMRVVVEPHADDAFLSLGQHIENWVKAGGAVKIVTVFSGTRKRAQDASAYARAVGALWQGLGLQEGEKLPAFFYPEKEKEEGIALYLPLAVTHPEHIAVRDWFEAGIDKNVCWSPKKYYLDSPYQIVQKNSNAVSSALYGMTVLSYVKPGVRKWRHIPLFKDQQKFFHFNPPEKLRESFELVVENPT